MDHSGMSMHFPVKGVLWFLIHPGNSCISSKSFLGVRSWLLPCSTRFQSSLYKLPTCCAFHSFHALSRLCPRQMQLTPISIARPVRAVLVGHLSVARIALSWEGRKEAEQMAGRKEGRCKKVVKLPCGTNASPLYLLILGCLRSQDRLCKVSECRGCGGVKAVLCHAVGRHLS